jgi:ABC-type transporter Mla MlaB component
MTSSATLNISESVARVEGVVDFDSVVSLKTTGEQWLKGNAPAACSFDFSGVSDCNSAATALLLDWLRTAKILNKQVTIVQVPTRLRDLMTLAGLEDVLAKEVK